MILQLEVLGCPRCPGDGVVRPKGARAGVDWPTPCSCEARRFHTQYTLGRLLDEDPRAIERVHDVCAGGVVSYRVFDKLAKAGLLERSS